MMEDVLTYIKQSLYNDLCKENNSDNLDVDNTLHKLMKRIAECISHNNLSDEAAGLIRFLEDDIAIRPIKIAALVNVEYHVLRTLLAEHRCIRTSVRLQTGNKKCFKIPQRKLTDSIIKNLQAALQQDEPIDDFIADLQIKLMNQRCHN